MDCIKRREIVGKKGGREIGYKRKKSMEKHCPKVLHSKKSDFSHSTEPGQSEVELK